MYAYRRCYVECYTPKKLNKEPTIDVGISEGKSFSFSTDTNGAWYVKLAHI